MRRRRQHIKDVWLEQQMFLGRTVASGLIVLGMALVVLGRLYYLQVSEFEYFAELAHGNRVRIHAVAPTRGLIYDRDGRVLAQNVPAFELAIIPEQIDDMDATLAGLAEILQVRDEDIARFRSQLEQRRRFDSIPLRLNLSDEEVAQFAVHRQRFPGVDVQAVLGRDYPYGAATAHLLGYVASLSVEDLQTLDPVAYAGTTQVGRTGIERAYEEALHGEVGTEQVLVNVQGRTLQVLDEQLPTPGRDLHLEVDLDVQLAAVTAMDGHRGAVVAIDPRDGAVRALVSLPDYDPNALVRGVDAETFEALRHDPDRPLFNRALAGRYPPGSTVKPFLALAGLELGAVTQRDEVLCEGWFQLEGDERRYRDWLRDGHGAMNLRNAVAQSCDVYFYQLALTLGIDPMASFLDRFGFGRSSGIDTVGEARGLMPSRQWKRENLDLPWYPGETVITGIGQGYMLITPLQLAWSTSALANRGLLNTPRLVAALSDPVSGRRAAPSPPAAQRVVLNEPGNWDAVISAAVAVIESPLGSAHRIRRPDVRIAGKSGTAQVVSIAQDQDERIDPEDVAEAQRDHALFIAWAPVEAPTIAVAVLVEHGGGGSSVAAPIARAVIDASLAGETP
jgi:penicillin-binding protein 2